MCAVCVCVSVFVCVCIITLQEQEQDLHDLKEEVHRLHGMLETAVSVNARRQAELQEFKQSVARLLVQKGIIEDK